MAPVFEKDWLLDLEVRKWGHHHFCLGKKLAKINAAVLTLKSQRALAKLKDWTNSSDFTDITTKVDDVICSSNDKERDLGHLDCLLDLQINYVLSASLETSDVLMLKQQLEEKVQKG